MGGFVPPIFIFTWQERGKDMLSWLKDIFKDELPVYFLYATESSEEGDIISVRLYNIYNSKTRHMDFDRMNEDIEAGNIEVLNLDTPHSSIPIVNLVIPMRYSDKSLITDREYVLLEVLDSNMYRLINEFGELVTMTDLEVSRICDYILDDPEPSIDWDVFRLEHL